MSSAGESVKRLREDLKETEDYDNPLTLVRKADLRALLEERDRLGAHIAELEEEHSEEEAETARLKERLARVEGAYKRVVEMLHEDDWCPYGRDTGPADCTEALPDDKERWCYTCTARSALEGE